jgi:hypothetical protein
VSLPTPELVFGAKPRLRQAAIDVSVVGDDEPVPVLERTSATQAKVAGSVECYAG